MFKHIKKVIGISVLVVGVLELLVKVCEGIRDYNKADKVDKKD